MNKSKLLAIIGSAESSSEHPLGEAIVRYVKNELKVESFGKCLQFIAVPGLGLKAVVSQIDNLLTQNLNQNSDGVFNYLHPNFETKLEKLQSEKKDRGDDYEVLIGNRNWIVNDNHIKLSQQCEEILSKHELMGYTSVICAINR